MKSTKRRLLESWRKPMKSKKRRVLESPLAEPSFAEWESSSSESEIEDFYYATELIASNLAPETTQRQLKRFFNAVDVVMGEDPEENPEEDPEEGETKKVARIWFKSRQATKEALKRNGEEVNGVPIRLVRAAKQSSHSSRKRGLEAEGRDDDKKRHASDESPLEEPSFANWESSQSENELEEFLEATELLASNFPPQTTELELVRFFDAVCASIEEEEIPEKKPEEKPEENPEEKSKVKTKVVAKIWFKSRQAKKEAFKRNGEKMNGVPIYLTRVANKRIALLVEDLDTDKSESDIKAQLTRHFGVCGHIMKIFIPKDDTRRCLSFGYVFMIQKSQVAEMENLNEMDGRAIKVSDCTFEARFRIIKEKMEAEGWVNYEVPEDSEDEEDEEDGMGFGDQGWDETDSDED